MQLTQLQGDCNTRRQYSLRPLLYRFPLLQFHIKLPVSQHIAQERDRLDRAELLAEALSRAAAEPHESVHGCRRFGPPLRAELMRVREMPRAATGTDHVEGKLCPRWDEDRRGGRCEVGCVEGCVFYADADQESARGWKVHRWLVTVKYKSEIEDIRYNLTAS